MHGRVLPIITESYSRQEQEVLPKQTVARKRLIYRQRLMKNFIRMWQNEYTCFVFVTQGQDRTCWDNQLSVMSYWFKREQQDHHGSLHVPLSCQRVETVKSQISIGEIWTNTKFSETTNTFVSSIWIEWPSRLLSEHLNSSWPNPVSTDKCHYIESNCQFELH